MPESPTSRTLEITLPWPPSANHYWRHVGSRVLISREGRQYRKAVCAALWLHPPIGQLDLLEGRLEVIIKVYPPDCRRRDLDNLAKALLDALEHAGAYKDDSQIDRLVIERGKIVPEGRVVVKIREMAR